ncbi:MAG: hypothetical protein K6E75_12325 [Lachnospiraceae bacterium]|nr:hypothetical protein [Lachnospiraceae bacterium]
MNEKMKAIFDGLSDELKEKAKACRNMDELTELAGKEGIELPDEVLDAVAGGCGDGCGGYGDCESVCKQDCGMFAGDHR